MHRRSFLFGATIFPVYFGASLGVAFTSKVSSQPTMQLTSQEKALAKKIGFDEAVLLLLKSETQGKIEQLKGYDTDKHPEKLIDFKGISVSVSEEQLWTCFSVVKERLPTGYASTVVENYDDRGRPLPDSIAVIKTNDRYDFLRIRNTDGANYDLQTEDLIAELKNWEKRFEFDIILVERALVSLEFKSLPDSLCSFAEEVYRFCPDSVDQGVSLAYEVLDDPEVFKAAKRLCAGVSFNSKYDAETIRGIELLAYDMQKTKQLGLWWD